MVEKKTAGSNTEYHCPYCDEEVRQAKLPWCQACGVKLTYCAKCGQPVDSVSKTCGHCGAALATKK
jgi:hypothetical protein